MKVEMRKQQSEIKSLVGDIKKKKSTEALKRLTAAEEKLKKH